MESTQIIQTKFTDYINTLDRTKIFIITDDEVFRYHKLSFEGLQVIVVPNGEANKNMDSVLSILSQLLSFGASRDAIIIGVGGGVITDMAGFVAAIFMRGVECQLFPTTILAMVDASIGGKNGVDLGTYKNIIGTIIQPSRIIYDFEFLKTLPNLHWINGFAEIIKHACILDKGLFELLEQHNLDYFKSNKEALRSLISRNIELKLAVVIQDEKENGLRKILNFGHTLGHAIEQPYDLLHGAAIAIGMQFANKIAEDLLQFGEGTRIANLLTQYQLPTDIQMDTDLVLRQLQADKKRIDDNISFILLPTIGKAVVKPISLVQLNQFLIQF